MRYKLRSVKIKKTARNGKAWLSSLVIAARYNYLPGCMAYPQKNRGPPLEIFKKLDSLISHFLGTQTRIESRYNSVSDYFLCRKNLYKPKIIRSQKPKK